MGPRFQFRRILVSSLRRPFSPSSSAFSRPRHSRFLRSLARAKFFLPACFAISLHRRAGMAACPTSLPQQARVLLSLRLHSVSLHHLRFPFGSSAALAEVS